MVKRGTRSLTLLVVIAVTGCQAIAGIEELPGPSGGPPVVYGIDSGSDASGPPPSSTGGVDAGGVTVPAQFASCAGLPKTCGDDGYTDCCDAPLVPGGTFLRDYDGKDFTDNSFKAAVHPFLLDRFEVTVGRFRSFVAAYAKGWRPEIGSGKNPWNNGDTGWIDVWAGQLPQTADALVSQLHCDNDFATYTDAPGRNDLRPVNCVTWPVAFAFCVWDGGRLPTDAEMNFAASGGGDQRYYALNGDIDVSRASYYVDDYKQCFGDHRPGCTIEDLTPVGTHPAGAGKWGHMDLSGNAAEWVRDGDASKDTSCNDCIDPVASDDQRRVRSASYHVSPPGALRAAAYFTWTSTEAWERIGMRCARQP